jgi:SPP1 family phage portal protein
VDSYCGYLATPGHISYRSEGDIEEIMKVLKYNDYQAQDSDFLLDALIYGTAAELMYLDNTGHTRFRLINPTTCFGIYDDSLSGDLMYFVRMYKVNDWDESDTYNVDVYGDYNVKHYTMTGMSGYLTPTGEDFHFFSQCPANIFTLPDEKNIFDCIVGLQDAANELLSDEIDDYSAFCDAYLALVGVDAEEDDIAAMKQNRVLILPEGASATWITKNANDAQVENILKRVHEAIYRVAQCPDFSSESFVGGVSSGIAIQYRLTGMETRAGKIEALMKKALQRRVEIISGIASLRLGEEIFRDIEITFKRNIPEDATATIAMINALKGTVSDATLLSQLPFITDVNAELEALQEQKQHNMELYSFGAPAVEEEEDEA